MAPIGELVAPVRSWDPRKEGNGDTIDYIDIGSVSQEHKTVLPLERIDAGTAPSRARQLVEHNDILVSTVRPNLNAVAWISRELDGATASTGFCILRPDQQRLDARYLFQWVRSPAFIAEMTRNATGQSYPAVSDRIVKNSMIPLPPLEEQKRIAAILDQADALRRLRRRALDRLNTLGQAIFHEMFGKAIRAARDRPSVRLIDVVDDQRGISYGIVQRGPEVEGGVPVIRILNLADDRFDPAGIVRTSPEIDAGYKRTKLRGGELAVSIRGSVGNVAIIPEECRGWNVSREIAVIPINDPSAGAYFWALLRHPTSKSFMLAEVRGVAQSGINLADLRKLPVPDDFEDHAIRWLPVAARLKQIGAEVRSEFEGLEDLFSSLQHRAFRGEL